MNSEEQQQEQEDWTVVMPQVNLSEEWEASHFSAHFPFPLPTLHLLDLAERSIGNRSIP